MLLKNFVRLYVCNERRREARFCSTKTVACSLNKNQVALTSLNLKCKSRSLEPYANDLGCFFFLFRAIFSLKANNARARRNFQHIEQPRRPTKPLHCQCAPRIKRRCHCSTRITRRRPIRRHDKNFFFNSFSNINFKSTGYAHKLLTFI